MRLSVLFALVLLVEISLCFRIEDDLTFKGRGKRSTATVSGRGNYKYQFSSGFQDDICDDSSDTNCWMTQGISKYGDFITRSMYQKPYGTGDDHTLLTIGERGSSTFKYSNILIQSGYCHAGDNVIRKIDDVYWFFIACGKTGFMIFSEDDIEDVSDNKLTVESMNNDKEFSYFVSNSSLMFRFVPEEGDYYQYLSRNNGVEDEYICGRYDDALDEESNLRLIKIDHENDFAVSILTEYKFSNEGFWQGGHGASWSSISDTPRLQGATKIGSDMYLTQNRNIYRCDIEDGDTLTNCMKHCTFKESTLTGFLCGGTRLALQGSETDSNFDLYVGSEFGNGDGDGLTGGCGHPFWEINSVAGDDDNFLGYCYADADPYNNIEQPQQPDQLPTNYYQFKFDYQTIAFILLIIATVFMSGMSCYAYCSGNKGKNVRYQSVKIVSDSEV